MLVFLLLGRADQLQLYRVLVLVFVEAGIQMSVRLRGHLRRLQVHLWHMVSYHVRIHIQDLRLVLIFAIDLWMSPL